MFALLADSACQAGEPSRRVPVAVGAPRCEMTRGHAEDRGQLLYFSGAESSLPAVAVAFGRAYGGGGGPAHQFAELGLAPSLALAQSADVPADDD